MSDEEKSKVHGSQPAASGSNGNASDSSEVELLLANEEEQEVDLIFARSEATERAETSDASPQIAVQQFAKSTLTTAASHNVDKFRPEGTEEERIPCQCTSMLTRQEVTGFDQPTTTQRGSTELEVISVEVLERRAQRQRALIAGVTVMVGVTLSALLLRRIVSHR